jgi:hypothetical protein
MNRKIIFAILVPMIVVTIFIGLTTASNPVGGIHAETRLVEHIFRGVGAKSPWVYIYVVNPTWQTVDIESVQCDTYAQGVFHPEWSARITPDWLPERWDTKVLPFETSVVLWFGYYTEEGNPEGIYTLDFTVYATVMGEDIALKTKCEFMVFL